MSGSANPAVVKAWRQAHPGYQIRFVKRWRKKNHDKVLAYRRKMYAKKAARLKWQRIWWDNDNPIHQQVVKLLVGLSTADHYESLAILETFRELTHTSETKSTLGATVVEVPAYFGRHQEFNLIDFNKKYPEELPHYHGTSE